jgi:hypothetical protein
MKHLPFPATSDQTPWPAALLSLLPFVIAGPLRIILSYQPGWRPQEQSSLYLMVLFAGCLAVAGGLALGAVKRLPRWAYPYPIYLAFSLHMLILYSASLVRYLWGWELFGQDSFWLILVVMLLLLWLPGLRWFYRNLRRDWTLLSYGLFGFVLYLLSTLDYDETPRLTLTVLLPTLISLGAALAHLRIRSAFLRIAVLLAGTFAGLFFLLLPIFTGMITLWIGIGIGMSMVLIGGVAISAILLAPMLLTRLTPPSR